MMEGGGGGRAGHLAHVPQLGCHPGPQDPTPCIRVPEKKTKTCVRDIHIQVHACERKSQGAGHKHHAYHGNRPA